MTSNAQQMAREAVEALLAASPDAILTKDERVYVDLHVVGQITASVVASGVVAKMMGEDARAAGYGDAALLYASLGVLAAQKVIADKAAQD